MFKKGQVIRGVYSGWAYQVLLTRENSRSIDVVILQSPGTPQKFGKKAFILKNRMYDLIGNNYQERPTRKEDC